MQTQVKTWGNSQGIILTKAMLNDSGFKVNDILDVTVSDGSIILTRQFRHKTLEERAKAYNDRLNLTGEFDWGDPVGREVW